VYLRKNLKRFEWGRKKKKGLSGKRTGRRGREIVYGKAERQLVRRLID